MALPTPAATADVTELADYLELHTLVARDGTMSFIDLARDLKRTGTAEPLDADDDDPASAFSDRGEEDSQRPAEDAFSEIEDRSTACAGTYPYKLTKAHVERRARFERSLYVFMLLLTRFGHQAGPAGSHPERLFEDICTVAARNYLGGAACGVQAETFGFPRRLLPKGFRKALDALCAKVGDMTPNNDEPKAGDQKDAKLDIVAWRPFPDRRLSTLIAFGQCAVGDDDTKANELQPGNWAKKWLRQHPPVNPVRLFFVPYRVPLRDLKHLSIDAGVVFDRCRIAALSSGTSRNVLDACAAWSTSVIRRRFRRR